MEVDSDSDSESEKILGLSVLGLQSAHVLMVPKLDPELAPFLNARGMPQLIRKKNPLFFHEDIQNSSASSSAKLPQQKQQRKSAIPIRITKAVRGPTNKSAALSKISTLRKQKVARKQSSKIPVLLNKKCKYSKIGSRLRNCLLNPKAKRFLMFEWFYSFLDTELFDPNDFSRCLSGYMTQLMDSELTRGEWRAIRVMMGRPRRCSASFFEEERCQLERKRQMIRILQSLKSGETKNEDFLSELPNQIPLALPIGTKVTARLGKSYSGFLSGIVTAIDLKSGTYRITVYHPFYEILSVLDIDIASRNFFGMISVHRPPMKKPKKQSVASSWNNSQETIDGHPIEVLNSLVFIKRLLACKRLRLDNLKAMNDEAELKICKQQTHYIENENNDSPINEDFQRRYASIVVNMDNLNRDLQGYFNTANTFVSGLRHDPRIELLLMPSSQEKFHREADIVVQRNNHGLITNPNVLQIIKRAAVAMLALSKTGNPADEPHASDVLQLCLEEMMNSTHPLNKDICKNVLNHMQNIWASKIWKVTTPTTAQGEK